jgi:hypothetical protein
MELIREECRVALATMGSLSTEMPYGQYFNVMDGFFHSFSNPGSYLRNCAVGRHFLDRPVPMLGVALHGSHNCGESVGAAPDALRQRQVTMLDLGLTPQYEVCMRPSPAFGIPAYANHAALLADAYQFACGPEGYVTRLGRLDIDGRWEPAPGVSRTVYRDGTEVLVNRGEREFDGVAVGEYRIVSAAERCVV